MEKLDKSKKSSESTFLSYVEKVVETDELNAEIQKYNLLDSAAISVRIIFEHQAFYNSCV